VESEGRLIIVEQSSGEVHLRCQPRRLTRNAAITVAPWDASGNKVTQQANIAGR